MSGKTQSFYIILIGAFLGLCLLAACGLEQARGSSAPPIVKSHSIAAMNQPTSIWTPVVPILPIVSTVAVSTVKVESSTATATSVAPASQCGAIAVAPNSILLQLAVAKRAEDCFLRAYRQCKPAWLVVSISRLDIVSVHTFGIERQQDGCAVSDVVQTSLGPGSFGRNFYRCTQLEMTRTSLRALDCGDEGTINIPDF